MDDTLTIIFLSLAMLVGCYLSGCIPLAFTFSEDKLKLVTIFGAGLLVGTALAVIVPEGVHSMYSAGHSHGTDVAVSARDVQQADPPMGAGHEGPQQKHADAVATATHSHGHDDAHQLIGVALVLGFVFMLLVDQLAGGHAHSPGPGPSGGPAQGDAESGPGQAVSGRAVVTTATLGLVVHAAADGIALGAATSVSQTGLSLIVFTAIMLHKAPASFGLVTFLLHESLDRGRIRKHLAVFSAAAPITAILTFVALNGQSRERLESLHASGLALLFSAGTFLYVATVHVLPEVSSRTSRTVMADGTVIVRDTKGFRLVELALLVTGAILPIFLAMGHHH